MVLLEFSLTPLDKGQSVSEYVARSLDIIDRSGLDYRLHAMGTIVEGELDQRVAMGVMNGVEALPLVELLEHGLA